VFMKSGLSVVVAAGLAALALRALGLAPLADLTALAYLAAATLTFGRPLATPIPPPFSRDGSPPSRRRASA
jgi:hypothetical protein